MSFWPHVQPKWREHSFIPLAKQSHLVLRYSEFVGRCLERRDNQCMLHHLDHLSSDGVWKGKHVTDVFLSATTRACCTYSNNVGDGKKSLQVSLQVANSKLTTSRLNTKGELLYMTAVARRKFTGYRRLPPVGRNTKCRSHGPVLVDKADSNRPRTYWTGQQDVQHCEW